LYIFLVTENYLVAVIRGVIYYVLLLMLFILFPLLFSSGLRNKATAVVVSITSCFAAIVILSIVLMYVPFDLDKFKKSTLLYDPIAVEALEVRKEIGGSVKIDISDLDRFRQVLFKAVQEGERRDGRVWISLRGIKEEFSRLKYIWKDKQKTYNRDLQKQLDTINKCKLSAKYNTNKTFLKLREKATSAGLNLIQEVDELTVEFNADISAVVNKLTNISKLQSDYYDSEIEYLRSTAQYYQFIVMCRNFLILFY